MTIISIDRGFILSKLNRYNLIASICIRRDCIRFSIYPKKHDLYQKLSDILGCDISYLMSEEESFITEAAEQFGSRGAKQAQQILEQAAAMFAGGELSDEDKTAFMDEIQMLYLDSKMRAKKYTPKKYLKDE